MIRRPACLVCLLLMAFLLAGEWAGFSMIRENPLPASVQKHVRTHPESILSGKVESFRNTEFSQTVCLKDTNLIFHSKKIPIQNTIIYLKKKENLLPGMEILVRGRLEEVPLPSNPGEFNSRTYYACQHIWYFLKKGELVKISGKEDWYRTFLWRGKEQISRILKKTAGKEAPILEAMLLGEKKDLDPRLRLQYQISGILHILAISGLHISILGVGLYNLLVKAGAGLYAAAVLSLFVMVNYAVMTGSSVSALRATAMFLLAAGAKVLGRVYDTMSSLALAAVFLLLDSPAYLYYSGFLLSFGAVVGAGAVYPVLESLFDLKKKLGKALWASLSVQLVTLPVMLWSYGEISLFGIFLNLLVLPGVGAVLVSGLAAVISGSVFLPAGQLCALPGRILLFLFERLSMPAGRIPFGVWIGGRPGFLRILLYYGLLFLLLFLCIQGNGKNRKRKWLCRGGILLFLLCSLWILKRESSPFLQITCLDIGQGDAAAVELPGKKVFLVDGGSSSKKDIGKNQILPFLKTEGISCIEAVFISHTDKDHISGIVEILELLSEGLAAIEIKNLVLPGVVEKTGEWENIQELAEKNGVKVHTANRGDVFRIGEGILSVLSPKKGAKGENVNEDGIVFQFSWKGFRGLFTGDIGEETEEDLKGCLEDVDFLKTAHHGSRYSTGTSFLEKTRPEISVISCAESNRYGHPGKETVERLKKAGSRVEFTMKSGAVTVLTDGERMWVRRHRSCSVPGFDPQ